MFLTANSIEGAAFINKGWVDKVFRKTVEAEERVSLMQKLQGDSFDSISGKGLL